MKKHFMKYAYQSYYRELSDGAMVLTTREDCFRFDPNDPIHALQRWEWDESDEHTYVVRLAATPDGKERGLAFDRERKHAERNEAYLYGCMAKRTSACKHNCVCENCPDFDSRSVPLTVAKCDADGIVDETERNGLASGIGNPQDELEIKDKHRVLAEFLDSLSSEERMLMTLIECGLKDNDIAVALNFRNRKTVYRRREALKAKMLGDVSLLENYTWLQKYLKK